MQPVGSVRCEAAMTALVQGLPNAFLTCSSQLFAMGERLLAWVDGGRDSCAVPAASCSAFVCSGVRASRALAQANRQRARTSRITAASYHGADWRGADLTPRGAAVTSRAPFGPGRPRRREPR